LPRVITHIFIRFGDRHFYIAVAFTSKSISQRGDLMSIWSRKGTPVAAAAYLLIQIQASLDICFTRSPAIEALRGNKPKLTGVVIGDRLSAWQVIVRKE
jgi:hypothetical protein